MPTLYWKNYSNDNAWNNVINWFENDACTIPAANAPWVDGVDSTYLNWDLTSSSSELSYPIVDAINIGSGTSGTCSIQGLQFSSGAAINGGTYVGDGMVCGGNINAGSFIGSAFTLNGTAQNCTIDSGGFINNGTIYSGNFIIYNGINNSSIYGGTFSGAGFTNNGGIFGGIFTGDAASYYIAPGGSITTATPYGVRCMVNVPILDVVSSGLH